MSRPFVFSSNLLSCFPLLPKTELVSIELLQKAELVSIQLLPKAELVSIQLEVLNLKQTGGNTHVAALVCLVAIEASEGFECSPFDVHRLTQCESDAWVAFLPCLPGLSVGIGHHHSATYHEIVGLAESQYDACRFGPRLFLGSRLPS